MVDATQPTESPQAATTQTPALLAPSMGNTAAPASTYDSSPPQAQVASDVAAEPAQAPAPAPKQPLSYQDQITKLQQAGFSGDEIQNYSINQAIKLRQAGFSQDEVDAYQGMKPPAVPGGTPIYGRVPTDKDFQNAASVILGGNDHPFYEKAVDTLKNLFTSTGVQPTDAVKIANAVPSFQEIMENGGVAPTWGDYGARLAHDAGSAVASGMQGLAAIKSYVNPNDPGVPESERGTNPETTQMYQKGAAFQQWINDKLPVNQKLNDANPIKMGIAGGIGSLIPLILTGGVGMAASGAGSSYEEAKQAGANPEKASAQATKMGAVWGVLGVVDVGMFLKPIQRSAPGVIPWITAKATQAVKSGLTFAGTNEFGEWLSSEIGQASDIPLQYKPTVQRIVVNALTGAVVGAVSPTSLKTKESAKPTDAVEQTETGSNEQPPPAAPPASATKAAKYTPDYHFDTDSYGIKNDKGEFVQTGYGSEEEAANEAKWQSVKEEQIATANKSDFNQIIPEVVNRYKQTIADEAEKQGFALTPEQLDQAAKVMAESHNPPNAKKPRTLAEVQGKTPTKPVETESPEVTQAKANIEYYQKALKELDTELMKHEATDNDAGIDKTLDAINQHKKWIKEEKEIIEKNKPKTEGQQSLVISTAEKPVAQEKQQTPVEIAPKPVEVEPPAAAANIEPPQSVFTSLAPTKKLQYDHLTAARKAMIAQGIDASRMRIADRQLTIDNPTHAESMHIRDAVQAQHDKYLKNSATGKANYQNRINNAAGKDPTTFKNFLTYLADHKGIKNDGGKEKISNLGLGKDVPVGLVRSDGMSHQSALEKAIEDRWIPDKNHENGTDENELNDLYDLIRDRGKKPHPEADAKQVSAQDRSDNLRLEMDKRGLHYDEKTTDEDAEKVLNAHKSLEELGINADGMSLKQMHDAMEMRSAEVTDENEALNDIRNRYPELENDYYPDMEEPYDEASFEGAHTGHEPEISASNERSEAGSEGAAGVRETEPIDAGVTGRGAEGEGADTGRTGADNSEATTFDRVSNVEHLPNGKYTNGEKDAIGRLVEHNYKDYYENKISETQKKINPLIKRIEKTKELGRDPRMKEGARFSDAATRLPEMEGELKSLHDHVRSFGELRDEAETRPTTFEPAKNVAGGGEQGVLGGMEQSAKQAMAARGEKIGAKVEQKPANEGLFGDKEEDRGEFLFQKSDGETKELPPQSQELLDRVKDIIKRIAPDATVEFVKGDGTAHGFYDRAKKIITIALSSPDQIATGSHEAFHAVWDLLTDAEKKTIIDDANNKGLMEKYGIKEKYAEQPENHDQEMAAHWFGDWMSDKEANNASPDTRTIFQKVKDILSGIADKIRNVFGQDATADDVFRKIESGDVGKREGGTSGEGLLFQKSDKDKPTLGEALKGIRDTFSPTSAGNGAKNTEVVLRESYGQAKRDQAIAETALNEFARQANEMTPDEHNDFYNYMEGRSNGAQLKNKQFQRMADTIRKVYSNYKDALQAMPETRMMNFVQDYFTHQWAKGQDEKIKEFLNSYWQQGSGKNLKERKIPTIADGLAYGLKLEEPNPVRAVSRYVGSMSHYMASVNVLRSINNELGGGFYADGKQPEGYAPLVGRNAERIENARVDEASGKLVPARNLHLYAPKEVADLYNAFYSKGFEDTKLGSAYMMVRNAINTNTMLELGLSAYHFSTINVQSFNQDVSRILRNALSGDWTGVGHAIKGLVTPGLHFIQGSKLMEQYKDLKDHGVDMEKIANLFASANMRLGQDPLANISNHGGFYKSWQRGELPGLIDRLKQQATEGYGLGLLKSGAEVVGKVVSDVSHPLFNVYVPAMKMSAFHDLMGDWLRQNPKASDGEISVNALRIGNMVEDRFGEMNMENIFWNQKAKELLGLTFRAPGWDIGLVRQVGGAGKDFYQMLHDAASGKKFNLGNLDRPLFMVGAVMSYVAMNAAMTYVKTGVMPSDQKMKDWIAYATGGVHKSFGWHPEQAELPGHGRELIQLAPNPGQGPLSGVTQEISNKIATLPKKIYEAANNRDWNGRPIYDPKANSWMQRTPGVAQFAHVAGGFEPFSMEQLFERQQPGSKLSLAERFLGVRAAGAKITAPEELKKFNEKHH